MASYAENVSIWWRHHDPQLSNGTLHLLWQFCLIYQECHIFFLTNLTHMVQHVKYTETHWGQATHMCQYNRPSLVQIMAWHQTGLFICNQTWGTYFHEILFENQIFLFKKMHFQMLPVKWRQFCVGLNVLTLKLQSKQQILFVITINSSKSQWYSGVSSNPS